MDDETAEFVFSPWSKISFWLDVFVESLLTCAFLLMASFGIVNGPNVFLSVAAASLYYVAAVFAGRVHMRVRHRHILDNRYAVSRPGISVQENGRQEFVEWDRFTRAEYLPMIPLYRLWAPGISSPVVLFAIGGWRPGNKVDRRRNTSKVFLREGLKSRLKTRWFPW